MGRQHVFQHVFQRLLRRCPEHRQSQSLRWVVASRTTARKLKLLRGSGSFASFPATLSPQVAAARRRLRGKQSVPGLAAPAKALEAVGPAAPQVPAPPAVASAPSVAAQAFAAELQGKVGFLQTSVNCNRVCCTHVTTSNPTHRQPASFTRASFFEHFAQVYRDVYLTQESQAAITSRGLQKKVRHVNTGSKIRTHLPPNIQYIP